MGQVKDHYKVLGVPRDETPNNIRRAFRRLAKEHHPDHAGAEGADRFREIAEAHDVLCDPASRRCHDEELRADERRCRPAPEAAAPAAWREREPQAWPGPRPWRPGELIRDVHAPWTPPAREARGAPELVLPAALARAGGPIRLAVAVEAPCPACHGVPTRRWLPACRVCLGRGAVERRAALEVVLPAGLRDGDALDLGPPGSTPLRVVVRVAADLR
jgi:molecular chaperone DnaJ